MNKFLIAFVALLLILFQQSMAGTTGKIVGLITDADTGEPLAGVNVILENTALGASTDVDGIFVILNVPPGLYSINISYIGYKTLLVKDVRINIDFTTRVDQMISPTTLEMETVEVFGERNPLVRKDLTNTQVAVTSEVINELPVQQINEVIALQAGVVVDNNGALHIRGGRSNEIAYQVNGLSINNPFNNSQGVGLATNAIEEVSVSAGTFSAEYGNALSGVINFVTKDGGSKYSGTVRAWIGDNLSSHKETFFNIDDVDPLNNRRLEWTVGGPVPLFNDKLTFFTSGVWQNDKGHLYGMRVYNTNDLMLLDGDRILIDPFGYSFSGGPDNTIAVNTDPENRGANGDRAIVPMVTRDNINLTGKLTWKPSPEFKISYDLIFDMGERYSSGNFRQFRFTPDGRPKTTSDNISHSVSMSHTLSATTFYTLKLGMNLNNALTAVYEDKFDPRYVPSVGNEISNMIIPPTGTYLAGGTDLGRADQKSRSLIGKVDFISQALSDHELKFGGEFMLHKLDYEAFTFLFEPIPNTNLMRFVIPDPEINPQYTDYQKYTREPVQGALYFLDKIELADRFIVNAGLRYEYLHTRAQYNPDLAGTVDSGVDDPSALAWSEPKHRVMPRLSLSFPITSQGIIRFSYGIFYQYPSFFSIYRNPRFVDYNFISTPTFGNSNLNPERSDQYELGLQQQFTDDIKMDLTVFYKDVSDLIDDRRIVSGEVAIDKEFNVFTNIGYAKVKGFTASFVKRKSPGGIFSATLDYTFQVGEGSYTNAVDLAVDTRTGRSTAQKLVPLDFDRTHTINATITLSSTNDWLASLIGEIRNGTPYTPSVPSSIQPIQFEQNSDRRPWYTNLNMRIEKFFNFFDTRWSIFLQVENVLDTKNEIFVHTNTGSSLSNLDETLNPGLFNNLRRTIRRNPGDFFPEQFLDDFYQREDWLSKPREVFVGMTFGF